MATTKKEISEEIVVQDEIVEETVDPWKNMVKMYIPRSPYGGKRREELIRVNSIGYYVFWNGTEQELPEPIACVVKSLMEARAREEDFREGLPTDAFPQNKL